MPRRPGRRVRLFYAVWLSHHLQGALASLGRMQRRPLPTLMTVSVIAIALALPASLYLVTRNLERLGGGWERTAALTLFLGPDVRLDRAENLARRLRARADVQEVILIDPEQALEEMRARTGFAEAVDQLVENPLPITLALTPAATVNSTVALERLRDQLAKFPESELVRLDTQWIRRFQAIVGIAKRGVMLLGGTLALGVLLVIGNTIRLEIENRRSEIEIMALVGATPAFIRRPFLYTGAWYGLLGGLSAWALSSLSLSLSQAPVTRLASLYQAEFTLIGLGAGAALTLLAGSVTLGLAGSWLSVSRHMALAEADPQ